jgi:hypothetical protein
MMQCETVSIDQAESLTGIPSALLKALIECQRIPAQAGEDGELYLSKNSLLGWCQLYARILRHVTDHAASQSAGCSPFELVWMSRNGVLRSEHGRA